ncbi:hypothetical protein T439DRAFT_325906 [Meredithblackwellia eburnea MCA 4105]
MGSKAVQKNRIVFYDVVGGPGKPFFSPATIRCRLALLTKGLEFETREVTYSDLRFVWSGKDKPLGVEKATVPFIQKPDGGFLMDSLEIVLWLDQEYPSLRQRSYPLPLSP